MAKPKKATAVRKTRVVGASLTPDDQTRLTAYGAHMRKSSGLRAKAGTLAAMLIRIGLDTWEANREAAAS